MTANQDLNAPTPSGSLSREQAIMGVFFLHAFAGGAVFTRIPDIQAHLNASEGALGLALMGQPIGALATFVFSSMIIEHFGTRHILMVFLPMMMVATALASLAPSVLFAGACFVLFGVSFALCNVAMNVEADRVEAISAGRVMNRCHGLWSLGFLTTALVGVGTRYFDILPSTHFFVMLPLIIIAVLFIMLPMQAAPPRAHTGQAKKSKLVVPTVATLMLVAFGFAGALIENGTRAWSAIYMRDTFDAAAWVDTLTLPIFLLMMTVGRLLSDGWIARHGPVRVALIQISIGLFGLLAVIVAQALWQAMVGFALLGFGICVIYPLTLSAAARLGDRPSSENVAAVTMVTAVVMLMAPAAMGFVAEGFGIRTSFAVLLPALLLSWVLVRQLAPAEATESA